MKSWCRIITQCAFPFKCVFAASVFFLYIIFLILDVFLGHDDVFQGVLYRQALDRQEEKKAREEEERAERVIAANKGRIQARPKVPPFIDAFQQHLRSSTVSTRCGLERL